MKPPFTCPDAGSLNHPSGFCPQCLATPPGDTYARLILTILILCILAGIFYARYRYDVMVRRTAIEEATCK